MPWASFSMLDGPGGTNGSTKTQVSLTKFSQSEVKIIHIIVQDQDGQNNNKVELIAKVLPLVLEGVTCKNNRTIVSNHG